MISSITISPPPVDAQAKSSYKPRIFPQKIGIRKALDEYRPDHRRYSYGGVLTIGVHTKPKRINPILTTHSISAALVSLVFDSLVRINSVGEIEPGLAEAWEISEDQLRYTFYLREGVKFHDGTEVTAEDVKFTYDLILDPKTQSIYRSHFEQVESFEVINRYTFRVVLKQPFIPLLYKMVRYIVPKHVLSGEDIHDTDFNYQPVGSGPFKFAQWDRINHTIKLTANPRYFEGRPYLDQVEVKTFSDVSQVWAAFMRREVDLVHWISSADYALIEKDPAFRAYVVPGNMYYAMVYNLQDPIFADPQIRTAIAHSLNVKKIIHSLPGLEGEKCIGPFHPQSLGFNPEVDPFLHNPQKGRKMLEQRGWADADNRGILERDDKVLEFRLLVDERSNIYKRIATIIRQQLAEVGIKVKILRYRDEEDLTEEYLKQHRPQAWLRLFLGFGLDPYEAMGNWYSLSSSQSSKLWNYKNREVDRLFEEGNTTTNVEERQKIYRKIHKIIYQEQPACFLFYPAGYFAINAKYRETANYFSLHMPTHTIKDWYIPQE